jgi:hypothetical protein
LKPVISEKTGFFEVLKMSFLAPAMLWGVAAAAIPIALHFFYRSRYRTVPWAAMKFLLTSIEQTSRRLRFQELLLLALRVLVLALLAIALGPANFNRRSRLRWRRGR